jgi:anti-sigma factor RsiW
MHRSVEDHIEEFLEGRLEGPDREAFTAHVGVCRQCHDLVSQMQAHSELLQAFRAPAELEPSPGFYARVMRRVEAEGRPSFWSLLLDPVFGRNLVYASAALVILMGVFLLATEPVSHELASTPVQAMAAEPVQPVDGENIQTGRDSLLVTLATFGE